MKYLIPFACCALFLAIAAGLAASGQDAETKGDLDPVIETETLATSTFRWKDIATNTYAQFYKDTYDYASAFVDVTYDSIANSNLRGHLSAANLKPNFAYQMKLAGKPAALWGAAGDDTTNERLGTIGRWWRHQPNPGNSNDADYEANHDQPGYIFEGYLVFDFFVTDSTGHAEKDIAIDSSYHVLWWEHQRSPGVCDSPVTWSTVIGHASHPAYEGDVGPTLVGVYAEIERNCTGTTTMPPGHYNCCFVLTEESFHQSGEDDGNWQSILIDDGMQFEIENLTAVDSREEQSMLLAESPRPNPFVGSSIFQYALPRVAHVSIAVYDVRGRRIRMLVDEVRPPGRYDATWQGRDESGRSVPSGLYFLRYRAGNHVITQGVLLVR